MIRKTSLLMIICLFISQLPVYCVNGTGSDNSTGNTGNNYSNPGHLSHESLPSTHQYNNPTNNPGNKASVPKKSGINA